MFLHSILDQAKQKLIVKEYNTMPILEQDAIDGMVAKQARIDNAKSAREKIEEMYIEEVGQVLISPLLTMDEIGQAIREIELHIEENSIYYESFKMLKKSYEFKIINSAGI